MPESMAAVVNHGPGDYRLEEVPRPRARSGEVVIQVEAAGICGSDAKCHARSEMFWGGPQPWVKAPVIPGHEFFGTVVEVGEGGAEAHGRGAGRRGRRRADLPVRGVPLLPPATGGEAAYGDAMLAAEGVAATAHDLAGWVRAADHQRRVEPDVAARAVYDDAYPEYLALNTDLRERFAALAQRR